MSLLRVKTKVLPGHRIEVEAPDLEVGREVEVVVQEQASEADVDHRPIWQVVADLGAQIPPEEQAKLPADGAKNYKHYLYGHPKQEE